MNVKKVLFVPGFLRDPETVQFAERKVVELQPLFRERGGEIVFSDCYGGQPSSLPLSEYAQRLAKEVENVQPDAIVAHSMGTLIVRASWKYYPHFYGPIVFIEGPNMGAARWQLLLTGFPLRLPCVKDMVRSSKFMKSLKGDNLPHANLFVEIQGKLARHPLAGKVFYPLHYRGGFYCFSDVDHRELPTDKKTMELLFQMLDHLRIAGT